MALYSTARQMTVSMRKDGAIRSEGEAKEALRPLALRPRLDLLGQGLLRKVSVAQAAVFARAPGKDVAVGGVGEVVARSSRHSDDALASNGLDLLW